MKNIHKVVGGILIAGVIWGGVSLAAIVNVGIRYDSSGGNAGPLNTTGDIINGVSICPSINDNNNGVPGCDMSADVGYSDNGTPTNYGDDFYTGDLIIRTNDTFNINVSYNRIKENESDKDEIEIVCKSPWSSTGGNLGYSFLGHGAECGYVADYSNSERTEVRCILRNINPTNAASVAGNIQFPVRVINGAPNDSRPGDISCSVSSPDASQIASDTTDNTSLIVTASPRWNIKKYMDGDHPDYIRPGFVHPDGRKGFKLTYMYQVGTTTASPFAALGNEALSTGYNNASISFTDNIAQVSPYAEFLSCDMTGRSGQPTTYQGNRGSQVCPSVGTTGDVTITHTGFDGRMNVGNVVILGYFSVFVPVEVVQRGDDDLANTSDDGSLRVVNTIAGFDPEGPSGASNFGTGFESPGDNTVDRRISMPVDGGAIFSKGYVYMGNTDFKITYPGDVIRTHIRYNNSNNILYDRSGVEICDVLDSDRVRIDPDQNTSVVRNGNGSVFAGDYVLEWGVGYETNRATWDDSVDNAALIKQECDGGPNTSRHTTLTGALLSGDISKVRVRLLDPLRGGESLRIDLGTTVRSKNTNDEIIPVDSLVVNHAAYKDDYTSGQWTGGTYRPMTAQQSSIGGGIFGDRAIYRIATAEIKKTSKIYSANKTNYKGGTVASHLDVLEYSLNWSVSNNDPTVSLTGSVRIVDVLPKHLHYISGSTLGGYGEPIVGDCANTAITAGCDSDSKVLVWELDNVSTLGFYDPIIFDVKVGLTVPNATQVHNWGFIETAMDPRRTADDRDRHRDQNSIYVYSPEQISIIKERPIGESESFLAIDRYQEKLKYLISLRNGSTSTVASTLDVIDVLPFNTDGTTGVPVTYANTLQYYTRSPGTSYTGSIQFSSASLSNISGYTGCQMGQVDWYFSSDSPQTINLNPLVTGNAITGGSTNRCAGSITGPDGSCGFGAEQVTAVRVRGPSIQPNGVCRMTINLNVKDNLPGNIYANNAGASADGFVNITSNTVPYRVAGYSLTGVVWVDDDQDGIQDVGESMYSGGTIELRNASGDVLITGTTNSNGRYGFSNMPYGDYTVFFVKPAAYSNTFDKDSGTTNPDNRIQTTIVGDGSKVNHPDNDFGIFLQNVDITGRVWYDDDKDGIMDGQEQYTSGTVITLTNSSGSTIATQSTTSAGYYMFSGVPIDTYTVTMTTPFGYAVTFDKDSGTTNPDGIIQIAMDASDGLASYDDNDFGLYQEKQIAGKAWYDDNKDGLINTGETYATGATITLTQSGNTIATQNTDSSGAYSFTGLSIGTYTVTLTTPSGYVLTFDKDSGTTNPDGVIQVAMDRNDGITLYDDNDFGIYQGQGIKGTVRYDDDKDGIIDTNESYVANASVKLTNQANVVVQTGTTNSGGVYLFSDIPIGTYTVTLTTPSGYVLTFDKDSGTTNPDGVIQVAMDRNDGITLYDDNDFGIYTTTITGGGGGTTNPPPPPGRKEPENDDTCVGRQCVDGPPPPPPGRKEPENDDTCVGRQCVDGPPPPSGGGCVGDCHKAPPEKKKKQKAKQVKEYEREYTEEEKRLIALYGFLPKTGVISTTAIADIMQQYDLNVIAGKGIYNTIMGRQESYVDEDTATSFTDSYSRLPEKYRGKDAYFVGYGSIIPVQNGSLFASIHDIDNELSNGLVSIGGSTGRGLQIMYGHTSSVVDSPFAGALLPTVAYAKVGSTFSVATKTNDNTYMTDSYIVERIIKDVDPNNTAIINEYTKMGGDYIIISTCQSGDIVGLSSKRVVFVARKVHDTDSYKEIMRLINLDEGLHDRTRKVDSLLQNISSQTLERVIVRAEKASKNHQIAERAHTLIQYIHYRGSYYQSKKDTD